MAEWRECFYGFYEVSNEGQVRRKKPCPRTGSSWAGRMLKPSLNWCGYYRVMLSARTVKKERKIHALVARAFIGPRPAGLQVNHKDGNRLNNHASNLEYTTPGENTRHYFRGVTRCRHGHEFTPENTRVRRNGRRACRACARRRSRDDYWRRRPHKEKATCYPEES